MGNEIKSPREVSGRKFDYPEPIYIYLLTDPRPDIFPLPIYVGKAKHPMARLKAHMREAKKRTAITKKNNWIHRLGELGLKPIISILETGTKENWEEKERFWIFHYRMLPGIRFLNQTNGGDGGPIDSIAAEKHRNSIRKSFEGGKRRLANSSMMKERWKNKEYRDQMVKAHIGKKPSAETLRKRSEAMKKIRWTEARRAKMMVHIMKNWRPVIDLSTGKEYPSVGHAARDVGILPQGIVGSANRGCRAGGRYWKLLPKQ